MAKQGTILVVDDNKAVLNALEMLLAGVFREVITIRTPNQIEAILESGRVDVVLLDMNFSAGINNGNFTGCRESRGMPQKSPWSCSRLTRTLIWRCEP